jgi:hypothetical protein
MGRRPRLLGAAVATIAGGLLAAGIAQAVTPPAGTPDLAQMALQPSDLGAGATPSRSGYVAPSGYIVADYQNNYNAVSTTAGTKLTGISTEVDLVNSTAHAQALYKEVRLIFASKLGRRLLADRLVKETGTGSGVTAKDVRFAKQKVLGLGDASALQPFSVRVKRGTVAADIVIVRVGDVLADLTAVVVKAHLDPAIATGLAGDVASHITAVLAAGSTGPTGATGATG